MAEKIRKKIHKPVAGADLRPEAAEAPVIREEPAADVQALAKTAPASETAAVPYAEFGGLSGSLAARRAQASRSREEAMSDWQKALEEQKSARLALVNAARPEPADAEKEQRKLRNLALGQAVGEFVGALFGGIQGLGSRSGRGYVPKMPGLYRNTLARLQQLRDNDILANEKYRNLMGSMLERNEGDRAAAARERWRDAAAEEKQLRTAQDYMDREAMRAGNRSDAYERQAAVRADLQQKRHQQRLIEQRNAAILKGNGRGTGTGVDDEVAYLTKLLLPKTRTSTTSGTKWGRTETSTTVRDATSYSKQEVAAATELARRIAPMVERHKLYDKDVLYLKNIVDKYAVSWDVIAGLLDGGVAVGDISAYLAENGME